MSQPSSGRIIRTPRQFKEIYPRFQAGDLVLGLMALKAGEEYKLLDLVEQGVTLFPAALAQLLSRSKAAQAEVLGGFMLPGTFVAHKPGDLLARLNEYHARGVEQIVTKLDRAHCGRGVNRWNSLEDLVSQATLTPLPYPLVVQPLVPDFRDLRAIILGDYIEAYERDNPHNFRNNLVLGGCSRPATLSSAQLSWCQEVMMRGKFPYAVIDLMHLPEGNWYLTEINLTAGLKAARLTQTGFREQVARLEEDFRRQWLAAQEVHK
ncbi:MAG: RimK family alpha-L-glutamate ligase [Desulfobacteraceae bacterium]